MKECGIAIHQPYWYCFSFHQPGISSVGHTFNLKEILVDSSLHEAIGAYRRR